MLKSTAQDFESPTSDLIPVEIRKTSLLTSLPHMEDLHTFHRFPVYIGCTDQPLPAKDIRADLSFQICQDTGFIQVSKLLPLDIVYSDFHSEGLGKVWADHYDRFADFILKFNPKKILEIGGGAGALAKRALHKSKDLEWTMIEPTPGTQSEGNFKVIQGFFDETFKLEEPIDAVIHSHVIEHLYQPEEAIKNIFHFLRDGQSHFISLPHLKKWLQNKAPNTLNFEHTVFLTEEVMEYLLIKNGFSIIAKEYYEDHSIFFHAIKAQPQPALKFENHYNEYKQIFLDFVDFHRNEISSLNKKMEQFSGPIYLFGAHIFSQFLVEMGLKVDRIECILDNSKIKQGKRLYGTSLNVRSPEILKNAACPGVILKAGAYTQEIKKQFHELNAKITYLSD